MDYTEPFINLLCIEIMRYKISDIADVFTGHTLRAKVEHDPEGECAVIQLKDLSVINDVPSLKHTPFKTSLQEVPLNQLLKNGDLLLLSKGSNNKTILYEGQFAPAIAVSAFTVIRLTSDQLKPEFINWYINSSEAQGYFNMHRAGTTTLNLSKKAIDELPVTLLPLEKQKIMMKLVRQYELYKSLVAEYEHNLKVLVEHTLYNHINEQ